MLHILSANGIILLIHNICKYFTSCEETTNGEQKIIARLDLSTQSLSAVLIDIDARTIVQRFSLDYQKDVRLKKYGIQGENYILPPKNEGEANQPPKMFLAAIDALFSDMKTAGISMRDILVCNTSAQQHGTLISAVRPVLLWDG